MNLPFTYKANSRFFLSTFNAILARPLGTAERLMRTLPPTRWEPRKRVYR